MLSSGNEIVMYEGYGFGRKGRARASGKQTAARKRFSSCSRKCRGKGGKFGPRFFGNCMRTCLRKKRR